MARDFNDQYYIILKKYSEVTLHLTALQKSADRDYEFEQLVWGQEPLFFENSYKQEDIKRNIKRPIPTVMLNMVTPIISSRIRERLKFFNFVGMQLYPAVYIDDGGNYHEDYWCMNFWQELDCWDREKSKTEKATKEELADPYFMSRIDVYKYHLDSEVLDKTPEEERLIFKQAGGLKYVFVHQKIADIFFEEKATGVSLVKVSDFEEGMQF
ncbi:imm11 family protein [Pseudoalteromonas maricaloris]|uniref:imm11 family protein n=1 Tax=Pseudoalteromonas maricaloris TaxID=184924 RepID=UPI003C297C39